MEWRVGGGNGGEGFPRVRARVHELQRAAEVAGMNAELAENGKGAGHRFRYQQVTAELAELERLLAWYEDHGPGQSWSAWQSWVLLLAVVGSMVLSALALMGTLG